MLLYCISPKNQGGIQSVIKTSPNKVVSILYSPSACISFLLILETGTELCYLLSTLSYSILVIHEPRRTSFLHSPGVLNPSFPSLIIDAMQNCEVIARVLQILFFFFKVSRGVLELDSPTPPP